MKRQTYEIDSGISAISATKISLDVATEDTDNRGYLLTNGNNRTLYAVMDTDYCWHIAMHTNSYDLVMPEANDNNNDLLDWLCNMGDDPDDAGTKIKTGIIRVKQAIQNLLDKINNDYIREDMDWYRKQLEQVDDDRIKEYIEEVEKREDNIWRED